MRKSPTFLSLLSLALFAAFILGAASGVKAQTATQTGGNVIWNWTDTTSANWETNNWSETTLGTTTTTVTPAVGFPDGAGTIVNIMADIPSATPVVVTIGTPATETVGFLAIGDVNGNNGPYTISGGTLIFNSGGSGRATLQNFVSNSSASWSTIASAVNIVGILDVNEGSSNAFMTTISGNISGGEIYKIGYGALKLTGFDDAAAGTGLVVEMRGAGDAGSISFTANGSEVLTTLSTQNANLILNNLNSNTGAFVGQFTVMTADGNGALVDGNASRGGTGSAVIQLGGNDQIQHTLTLNFDGVSGSNPYFKLGGFSVTVAGINDYDGQGYIENQESEAAGLIVQNGTLNLVGTGFYSYNGVIRDKNSNGTSQVQINKTGTGTQVLSGGSLTYTGNTTDTGGGLLRLIQATAFNSNITVSGGSTLELQATGTWNFGSFQNGTTAATPGTGHDITFGSSSAPTTHDNLTISGTSNLNFNQNILTAAGGVAANLNVLPNATTANTFTFNGGKNSFNNFTFNALYLPSLNTYTTVQFQAENPQEAGTIAANTITMAATSGILVGMAAFDPTGASIGTVQSVTSTTVVVSGTTANTTGTFTFEGGSEAFAGNAVVTGPFAAVDVQAPTAITGSLTLTRSKFTVEPSSNVTTIAGGTLSVGSITLGGSTLDTIFTISNTSGSGNITNRVTNAANVTSNGGQIVFANNADTGSNYAQTLGTLALASGDLEITTSAAATGKTSTLAFGALSRSVGSTITFSTVGIGTTTANEVTFSNGAALNTANGGIIGGWATVASTVNSAAALEFATNGSMGITALTSYVTNTFAGTNPNVKLTAASTTGLTAGATTTINSLNLQSTGAITESLGSNAATKLVITSGGLLDDQASHTINGSGFLTTVGGGDLIPTVASGQTLTLASTVIISDNGTAVGLTKAGVGQLILSETANTFTGSVYLNEGNTQIAGNGSLGTTNTSTINFDGGALSLASNGTSISRAMNLGPGGGQLAVAPGATATVSSAISGPGVLTYIDNYEASTSAASGTLNLTGLLSLPGGLETNNALNTSGAASSLSTASDTSIVNVTGTGADSFGHIRVNGSTLNLGGAATTYTITGDIVMSTGTLNLFGTNNLTSATGPNIFVAGGALVLNSAGALGNATSSPTGTPVGYTGGSNPVSSTGLTLSGGTGGTVYLNGFNLMVNVLIGSSSSTETFTIDDSLPLQQSTTTVNETLFVNTVSNNTFTGLINDEYNPDPNTNNGQPGNILGLTKMGTGNLTIGNNLTGAINDYHGPTTIAGGTLTVFNLSPGGFDSSIGSSSSDASNLIISNGAALAFAGTYEQFTDRSFTIGSAGSDAASIIADGATRDAIIHFGVDPLSGTTNSAVAFTGSGARTLTLGGFNQGDNSFNEILGDVPSAQGGGVVSLNKIGNGTWLLTESNTYTGLTTVSGGVLAITANNALGATSGGTILEGGASTQSFSVGGVLDLRNVSYTAAEPLFLEGGELATTTGTSIFGGPVNISLASVIQVSDGASLQLTNFLSGVGAITQLGQGTLILSGNSGSLRNSTLDTWTVQAGVLELDYTTSGNVRKLPVGTGTGIAAGTTLTLGGSRLGGELLINDGSTTVAKTAGTQFAEIVSGLSLAAGENKIVNSAPNDTTGVNSPTVIMVLNGITVASGATLSLSGNNIATTSTPNKGPGSILGAWATINGNDWAYQSTTSFDGQPFIAGLSIRPSTTKDGGYTPVVSISGGDFQTLWGTNGSDNVDVNASSTQTQSAATAATLRFNTPGSFTTTLTGTHSTVQTGGIIMTPTVGANDEFITGGALTSGTGAAVGGLYNSQDFLIYQNDTQGKLVINSPIVTNFNAGV